MKGINSHHRKLVRECICNRYGSRCAYCNTPTPLRTGTVDHYFPVTLGGTNTRKNLRWSCLDCNGAKGCMLPSEWEEKRPQLRPWVENKTDTRLLLLQHIAQIGRGAKT